jgi:hypothetical protein
MSGPVMTSTHVVLIRWGSGDAAVRATVEEAVRALPASIPQILDLRAGPSTSPAGREAGYEWGFVMTFANESARDAYLVHPAHLPVADLIGRAAAEVLVFDI